MSVIYRGPGRYVAVCNTTNFDGHYIKLFEVPAVDTNYHAFTAEELLNVEAAWWFLNRVDFVACIDAVYPLEIFNVLRGVSEPTQAG